MIVSVPVRQVLNKEALTFPNALVANTCALLATIVGELAATAMGLEVIPETVNIISLMILPTALKAKAF